MSATWPKLILDPVHELIPFEDNSCDRLLLSLINSKEFQRLRRIKQLGLSQLVFPGADHSRFAHSIGVMHTARRFLDRLSRICPECLDEEQRTVVLVAALLHDVGHGPFSHAFEKVTKDKHEARTLQILCEPETELNRILSSHSRDLPDRLRIFFDEDLEEADAEAAGIPAYLTQIVTSQLDADRFDYLLRDSYATGADYGRFDIDWIIEHLDIDSKKNRFFLPHKAMLAAEAYVFARYQMYRSVYYHKTSRAAEVMLRLLFDRYKQLLGETAAPAVDRSVVPLAPPTVFRAFNATAAISLSEYLLLDDHALTEFAKACTVCSDKILQELAAGLLHRRLFKATDATSILPTNVSDFTERAKEIIRDAGHDPAYAFISDTPSDTAYKLYSPDAEKPATEIYVVGADGRCQELSRCSDTVAQLTKKYTLIRYYYPIGVRERISHEAEPLLRRN